MEMWTYEYGCRLAVNVDQPIKVGNAHGVTDIAFATRLIHASGRVASGWTYKNRSHFSGLKKLADIEITGDSYSITRIKGPTRMDDWKLRDDGRLFKFGVEHDQYGQPKAPRNRHT